MNKKQLIIAVAGTAVVGGVLFFILNNAKRKNRFNELLLVLEESKAQAGGDVSYLKAFTPGFEKESSDGKKILLYTAAKVEQLVDALHAAFKTKLLKLSGTDEEAIFSIYQGIESQKKMAQVATRYQAKYGVSLNDKINSELTKNERTRLFSIVKNKPAYQSA